MWVRLINAEAITEREKAVQIDCEVRAWADRAWQQKAVWWPRWAVQFVRGEVYVVRKALDAKSRKIEMEIHYCDA